MAATYILQALRQVSAAIDEVHAARVIPGLTAEQYSSLTSLYFTLDRLHDDLLAEELEEEVDSIDAEVQKLKEIVVGMQAAAAKIQGVIDAVAKAAEAIETATKIIALGAKLV